MKKYLVLYYSKTGNSKFIAEQLANKLDCDIREVKPVFNGLFLLFLLSVLKISVRLNVKPQDLKNYEKIIIIGPVWGGLLVSPLRRLLKMGAKNSKHLHFAVTCETKEEDRYSKFGFEKVLADAKKIGGYFLKNSAAFSTSLVMEGKEGWSPKLSEKIKITEDNFKGTIVSRFDDFLNRIKDRV